MLEKLLVFSFTHAREIQWTSWEVLNFPVTKTFTELIQFLWGVVTVHNVQQMASCNMLHALKILARLVT
jgi:hypothetical protein